MLDNFSCGKFLLFALAVIGLPVPGFASGEALPPKKIEVLPIFFVPQGKPVPSEAQKSLLMKHLKWCQTRYSELLPENKTFSLAADEPKIYMAKNKLEYYKLKLEGGAPAMVGELLDGLSMTRYNCPYIFFLVVMNPEEDFPGGGGRPFNGGYNTGGGLVQMSSFSLDQHAYFQSTIEHELGHSFGLPHVDVYGYDMKANPSIMSYDVKHRTRVFKQGEVPAIAIPEDLRGLALNQRAFPGLRFDPDEDVPANYNLAEKVVSLGPMKITGHPDGVVVKTVSGEFANSKVANIVQGQRIDPNLRTDDGVVHYDASTMWHSDKTADGWVSLDLEFPYEVELSSMVIHSQHTKIYNAAHKVKLSVKTANGSLDQVVKNDLTTHDDKVRFTPVTGRHWHLELQGKPGGYVTLRGLQFFAGDTEVFPPLVPGTP